MFTFCSDLIICRKGLIGINENQRILLLLKKCFPIFFGPKEPMHFAGCCVDAAVCRKDKTKQGYYKHTGSVRLSNCYVISITAFPLFSSSHRAVAVINGHSNMYTCKCKQQKLWCVFSCTENREKEILEHSRRL